MNAAAEQLLTFYPEQNIHLTTYQHWFKPGLFFNSVHSEPDKHFVLSVLTDVWLLAENLTRRVAELHWRVLTSKRDEMQFSAHALTLTSHWGSDTQQSEIKEIRFFTVLLPISNRSAYRQKYMLGLCEKFVHLIRLESCSRELNWRTRSFGIHGWKNWTFAGAQCAVKHRVYCCLGRKCPVGL